MSPNTPNTPPTPTEPGRVEELRALDAAATRGPWTLDESGPQMRAKVYCDDSLGSMVADCASPHTIAISQAAENANAALIVAMRNALPALLAAHDAAAALGAERAAAMKYMAGRGISTTYPRSDEDDPIVRRNLTGMIVALEERRASEAQRAAVEAENAELAAWINTGEDALEALGADLSASPSTDLVEECARVAADLSTARAELAAQTERAERLAGELEQAQKTAKQWRDKLMAERAERSAGEPLPPPAFLSPGADIRAIAKLCFPNDDTARTAVAGEVGAPARAPLPQCRHEGPRTVAVVGDLRTEHCGECGMLMAQIAGAVSDGAGAGGRNHVR